MPALQPGDKAPDFKLPAHTGVDVQLSAYLGRRVVVAFHPATFTGGWKNQVNEFRENYEEFKKLNAEVLEISVDSVHAQKTWAEQLKDVPFPILSDFWPHGAVGKMFGIFNEERGMDRRSVFLLDASHTVRWSKTYEPGTIPQSAELLEKLKEI